MIKKVPGIHGFCPPNTPLLRIFEFSFLRNVDHVEAKRIPFEFKKSTGKNRRSQGGPKQPPATNRGSQEPATNRVNKCLSTGVFPTRWKDATVIPVHKKGLCNRAENYRSVSLLPIVAKVFEKISCDAFVRHITPAISPSQHGFVPGKSCVTNLSEFMFYATSAIQSKSQLDVIYTDF